MKPSQQKLEILMLNLRDLRERVTLLMDVVTDVNTKMKRLLEDAQRLSDDITRTLK